VTRSVAYERPSFTVFDVVLPPVVAVVFVFEEELLLLPQAVATSATSTITAASQSDIVRLEVLFFIH
jgi:hypothetical protein